MIEQLFGSKTRVKLLHLFYNNPNRSFYVREITRKIDEQINSVRRELSNLLSIGVIKSSSSGNKLYYEVDQKSQHYDALRQMFTHIKPTAGSVISGSDTASEFKSLGSVDYAALSGVFTKDTTAPVDVLVVGDINRNKLDKLIVALEEEEGQELRYTVLSREEYDYRHNLNDRFLSSLMDSKLTVLIDKISTQDEEKPKKKAKKKKTSKE